MRALFEVDEEVILQSKSNPQCNGECTVLSICEPSLVVDGSAQIGYKTTISPPKNMPNEWAQSALKKKHTPGDSLESIMSSLKDQTIASYIDDNASNIAEILKRRNRENPVKED